MTRIRLKRIGAKGQPYYRIVVADQRAARNGKVIEKIGWYNPREDPPAITLNAERAEYWVSQGAQLSDSVKQVLKTHNRLKKVKTQ